MMIIIKLV